MGCGEKIAQICSPSSPTFASQDADDDDGNEDDDGADDNDDNNDDEK